MSLQAKFMAYGFQGEISFHHYFMLGFTEAAHMIISCSCARTNHVVVAIFTGEFVTLQEKIFLA